jgi:hypothetical protein
VGLCPDRRLLSPDTSAILDCVTPRSLCTRTLTAGAVAATLLLTACGSPPATVTPSSSTSPSSTGSASHPFTATAFTTVVPAGWTDDTTSQSAVASVSGSGTVVMLFEAVDGGHIDARTAPQPIADDQLAQYLESVSQGGATNLSTAEPVDIDGVSGVMITYNLTPSAGVTSKDEDMVVNQGGDTYDIVLNTIAASFTADQAALQTVLNSWKWT